MEPEDKTNSSQSWIANVLTDIHFWVPLAVLVSGLLLLKFVH